MADVENSANGNEPRTSRGMRGVQGAFIGACVVLAIVPAVGMLWAPTTETTENRELASVPRLTGESGDLNVNYLSDWGTYFEDHFAYRNQLVTLNAHLRLGLLGVSSTDSVVAGSDGWLYYAGTLSDYCGWEELPDRAVKNAAFNLSLMQGYVQSQGANFTVALVPNKNTLYSERMPAYYLAASEETHALSRLVSELVDLGVTFVDLRETFESQDEVLYYLRDSHWNTKGALLASQDIMASYGRYDDGLQGIEPTLVYDYIGDLNEMLFPAGGPPEMDYSYADSLSWSFVEGESMEDAWVETIGQGEGSLLMYRDSFGDNSGQFFADSYERAYFTRMVPYDLTQVGSLDVDDVVIERVERSLDAFYTNPAIMPAPSMQLDFDPSGEVEAGGVSVEQDGPYQVVSGDIPGAYRQDDTAIYIGVRTDDGVRWFVPFRVAGDGNHFGYKAYLPAEVLEGANEIWVACENDGTLTGVQMVDTW